MNSVRRRIDSLIENATSAVPAAPIQATDQNIEWTKVRAQNLPVFDIGKMWVTADGAVIYWSGNDAVKAHGWLQAAARKTASSRVPTASKPVVAPEDDILPEPPTPQ